MTDIVEVPLDIVNNEEDNQNSTEDIQNNTENNQDNAPILGDIEEIPPIEKVKPVKAKAKGRPPGAPNKGPSKPRAKKVQIQEAPMEDNAYEPSSPKRNLRLPTDSSSSDVAAAVLRLLQDQSYSRQSRKQRLYSSWFQ